MTYRARYGSNRRGTIPGEPNLRTGARDGSLSAGAGRRDGGPGGGRQGTGWRCARRRGIVRERSAVRGPRTAGPADSPDGGRAGQLPAGAEELDHRYRYGGGLAVRGRRGPRL